MKKTFILAIAILLSLPSSGCAEKQNKIANPDIPGKFVFGSLRSGKRMDGSNVYILKKSKVSLFVKRNWYPRWSPDGKNIACIGRNELLIYDESTNLKKIFKLAHQPYEINWLPDGKSILYAAREDIGSKRHNLYLILLKLEDGSVSIVKEYLDKSLAFRPSSINISPDGKRLVFSTWTQGEDDDFVHLMNIDSSDLRQLRKDAGPLFWFLDNKHIAFVTNRDENGNLINTEWGRLYKMNVDTGETTIIEETQHSFYQDERISKDGKYMYYSKPTQENGHQIMMCPIGEREKEVPVTYPLYVNPDIKYADDRYPDWYQGE